MTTPFVYFKYKNDWVYTLTLPVADSVSRELNHSSLCLSTNTFNPEKYLAQLNLMHRGYLEALDPTKALEVSLHDNRLQRIVEWQDYTIIVCCLNFKFPLSPGLSQHMRIWKVPYIFWRRFLRLTSTYRGLHFERTLQFSWSRVCHHLECCTVKETHPLRFWSTFQTYACHALVASALLA